MMSPHLLLNLCRRLFCKFQRVQQFVNAGSALLRRHRRDFEPAGYGDLCFRRAVGPRHEYREVRQRSVLPIVMKGAGKDSDNQRLFWIVFQRLQLLFGISEQHVTNHYAGVFTADIVLFEKLPESRRLPAGVLRLVHGRESIQVSQAVRVRSALHS